MAVQQMDKVQNKEQVVEYHLQQQLFDPDNL